MSYTLRKTREGQELSGGGCNLVIKGSLSQRIRCELIRRLAGNSLLVIINANCVDGKIPVPQNMGVFIHGANDFYFQVTDGRFPLMVDNLRQQGCLIEEEAAE